MLTYTFLIIITKLTLLDPLSAEEIGPIQHELEENGWGLKGSASDRF